MMKLWKVSCRRRLGFLRLVLSAATLSRSVDADDDIDDLEPGPAPSRAPSPGLSIDKFPSLDRAPAGSAAAARRTLGREMERVRSRYPLGAVKARDRAPVRHDQGWFNFFLYSTASSSSNEGLIRVFPR